MPSDFVSDETQYAINVSNPFQCIPVQAVSDNYPEDQESFSVSVDLVNTLDNVAAPDQIQVTITDDDGKKVDGHISHEE